MSTNWLSGDVPIALTTSVSGFPEAEHPAEASLFCRQAAMPQHRQHLLECAHIVVVGCGGLGGWISLALARMGVEHLTLIDPDCFERTNAPRQLMLPSDLGLPKAHAVAKHLGVHMTNHGAIRSIVRPFQEAIDLLAPPIHALVVGADNNAVRIEAAAWARVQRVPAIFAMLSSDGLRSQVFRQNVDGPCLSCVLPDLDSRRRAPCAAAAITSCFLAAAHSVQMVADIVMGGELTPSWRESSLDGSTERVGTPGFSRTCKCRTDSCRKGQSEQPRGGLQALVFP